MRILGLDPSLTSTGWAVVKDGKVIASGTIKTTAKDEFSDRLMYISDEIFKLCSRVGYNAVAIEEVFVNRRNISTSIKLAKVHGAIIAGLPRYTPKPPIKTYAPKTVKQAVTGSGRADKEQVIKMVQLQAGYKGKQTDEADAIAVALTCERELNIK